MTWERTARRPITSVLLDAAARVEAEKPAVAAVLRAKAAQREADRAWWVTVRTVGTRADPLRYDVLVAKGEQAIHQARVRARKLVIARDGLDAVTDDAVATEMLVDTVYRAAMSAMVAEWLEAGLVDPENEMARLYALGGGDLLRDAVVEVRRHNEVSGPLG